MTGHALGLQRRLPLRKAAGIALRNLRIRWWRSGLVTLGIVLAIAFLLYILVTESFLAHIPARGSAELFDSLRRKGLLEETSNPGSRVQTWWMVSIALVICFVGILNAMVMAVTERTREIGTMKCLGALDSFIVKMYLLESLFQGIAGTAAGIVAGVALAYLQALPAYGGETWTLIPAGAFLRLVGLGFAAGVVLTVAGALYPAVRASRMQPIDAMRTEV